ncbi:MULTISPECIES: helix-turn-helix domain-containing protein [unclassified Sphingopyxis]|uniref:helix-turn-helix domain-containing protein n=1 Tax=unclassified Sphingopyxis TaxID=2614943 RepID=UPI0012E338CC|nr:MULTISPECIES: helix-turn-helix domain-containing protein [unclassified Sphingopyxis]
MEDPFFISIREFCRRFGIARTKTYQLINRGELETAKIGSRTLVSFESAKNLLERSLIKTSDF